MYMADKPSSDGSEVPAGRPITQKAIVNREGQIVFLHTPPEQWKEAHSNGEASSKEYFILDDEFIAPLTHRYGEQK